MDLIYEIKSQLGPIKMKNIQYVGGGGENKKKNIAAVTIQPGRTKHGGEEGVGI